MAPALAQSHPSLHGQCCTFDDLDERFLVFVGCRSERADENELGEESGDVL